MSRDRADKPTIDTAVFRRETRFARGLRWTLRKTVLPRFEQSRRPAYDEQFADSSRTVEIAVEGIGRLLNRHAWKSTAIFGGVGSWAWNYFGTQRAVRGQERTLIYTQFDHAIPFRPDQDILYAYVIAQIAYIANTFAEGTTRREVKQFVDCFAEMNRIGRQAFRRTPTVMPRFQRHDRLTLTVVQALDAPVNCCPSLHISYSLMLYNIVAGLLWPERADDEALESTRYTTVGMFESVLFTKQHAILDVAFGMALAREVWQRAFDATFDDLAATLAPLEEEHRVPYGEILAMYRRVLVMRETRDSLADVLEDYLAEGGYPTVGPDEELTGVYFDTVSRAVVPVS